MVHSLYWVSALTFAIVLIFVLVNELYSNKSKKDIDKTYKMMILWVIFFCIQDVFWGLFASHTIQSDTGLFISSTVFHLSTVLTTFFWLKYIVTYLGEKIKHKKLYLYLDMFIIACQVAMLVANFFIPTIFEVVNGEYVTAPFRTLAFMNQYIVYFIIGLTTFICAMKEKGESREKFLTVFFYALAPILSGAFQFIYPDGPFYSMGYFLGCFVVHIFIVSKDREKNTKSTILKSIADIYYSMHLIDLEEGTVEEYISSNTLNTVLMHRTNNAQKLMREVMKDTVTEEYLDKMLEFTNLSTVSERLEGSKAISKEFVGTHFGWTRVLFIPVETDSTQRVKKVMFATQIIDKEKRKEESLIKKSNTDQLTGFLNRRAYEDDVMLLENKHKHNNLVYVSLDVNGLKVINDSLGHEAGDKLLKGAAFCIKKCYGSYGKVYRVGGDEFAAIISADKSKLEEIDRDFTETTLNWDSPFQSPLAVSCGYASKDDFPDSTIYELAKIADDRMYESKSVYYRQKGVDRRGQIDAHIALCNLYAKILKINITDDTFNIVNMDVSEQTADKGFADTISQWLKNFGESGQVHNEDLGEYFYKTNIEYMREYFRKGKKSLSINYRRKYGDVYKQTVMEMIPAGDYKNDNQSLFLYVKSIDK